MYRPDAEMEDFTARRGYSPAFIRKVHEKRRKERLARVEADRLAKRQLAVEDREARKLTARDRKLLSQEPCANADSDALFAMPAPGWVKDIVAHVCKAHGVSISLLLGERRSKAIVTARHEAFYLCRKAQGRLRPSLPIVGRWFGRDHTGIMHGVARHAALNGLPNLTDYDIDRRDMTVKAYVARERGQTEVSA